MKMHELYIVCKVDNYLTIDGLFYSIEAYTFTYTVYTTLIIHNFSEVPLTCYLFYIGYATIISKYKTC